MKVIIICNIFIWNRQVNCVLLYSLQLKWVLWFFRFQNSALITYLWKLGYSTPDTECSIGLTDKAIPPCRVTRSIGLWHPSPGALGRSFLSSWHHRDADTAAATSAWIGGWTADSSTQGFLCQSQESREEVQPFVRAHDSQGSEGLS